MTEITDPTFYRTPADAIAAAPESLAYVAAFDPHGDAKDALAVLDCDSSSVTYGEVVGWAELPTGGNELHHFGWNACSSALCHGGHAGHLERRYLIAPGLRSSRTYVLDTKPDPRTPHVVRTIEADELANTAGYSRPHTCTVDRVGSSCRPSVEPTATTGQVVSRWSTMTRSTPSGPGNSTGETSSSPTSVVAPEPRHRGHL